MELMQHFRRFDPWSGPETIVAGSRRAIKPYSDRLRSMNEARFLFQTRWRFRLGPQIVALFRGYFPRNPEPPRG